MLIQIQPDLVQEFLQKFSEFFVIAIEPLVQNFEHIHRVQSSNEGVQKTPVFPSQGVMMCDQFQTPLQLPPESKWHCGRPLFTQSCLRPRSIVQNLLELTTTIFKSSVSLKRLVKLSALDNLPTSRLLH